MIEVFINGLCEPANPGGAACFGYVIEGWGPTKKHYGVVGTGWDMTNNVAEYTALIRALQRIRKLDVGKEEIVVKSDSLLVVNQMRGTYKGTRELLLPLYTEAKSLAGGMDISFEWIPREINKEADKLSRLAYRGVRNKVMREIWELEEAKKTYFQL